MKHTRLFLLYTRFVKSLKLAIFWRRFDVNFLNYTEHVIKFDPIRSFQQVCSVSKQERLSTEHNIHSEEEQRVSRRWFAGFFLRVKTRTVTWYSEAVLDLTEAQAGHNAAVCFHWLLLAIWALNTKLLLISLICDVASLKPWGCDRRSKGPALLLLTSILPCIVLRFATDNSRRNSSVAASLLPHFLQLNLDFYVPKAKFC